MSRYFSTFGPDGRRLSTYVEGLHPEIPAGAVEHDEATWRELIDHPLTRRYDRTLGRVVACPPPAPATTWEQVRRQRDRLLRESDWTQLPDAPADRAAWAAYRQALRDLPQRYADPAAVIWPDRPA